MGLFKTKDEASGSNKPKKQKKQKRGKGLQQEQDLKQLKQEMFQSPQQGNNYSGAQLGQQYNNPYNAPQPQQGFQGQQPVGGFNQPQQPQNQQMPQVDYQGGYNSNPAVSNQGQGLFQPQQEQQPENWGSNFSDPNLDINYQQQSVESPLFSGNQNNDQILASQYPYNDQVGGMSNQETNYFGPGDTSTPPAIDPVTAQGGQQNNPVADYSQAYNSYQEGQPSFNGPALDNFISQAQPVDYNQSSAPNVAESIDLRTEKFEFEEEFNPRQETLKEGMAPASYVRGEIDYLIVGTKYARVFCIEGLPDQVYIGYLRRLYSSDYDLDINLAIQPRQQSEARKELQDKLTIVRAQLEEEIERGANRNRDTFQIQISKLEEQIAELASREELAYEAQFLFTLYADSKEELSRNTISLIQELKEEHITPQVLALRQDEGYRSVVPYGIDYLNDKKRNFNTGSIISSIPFYIPELYDEFGVYLGYNTYSGTPALLDLYKPGIQNSNLNVFGTSGSGKSTLVKFLTMRSSLLGIRTVIIDPEGEYSAMTKKLHGAVFRMSTDPNKAVMMNIFDVEEDVNINPETGEQESSLELRPKYEDISGFIKAIYPKMDKGQEANLLEVIEELYFRFGFVNNDVDSLYESGDVTVENGVLINNLRKKTMPQLSNLIDLMQQFVYDGTYPNLSDVVDSLQPYRNNKTRGMFDTQTPKSFKNLQDVPVITFDISSIESSDLKTLSMYVLLNWVWEKFGKKNPHIKKRILVDEAWMMMSPSINGYEYTSTFLETMSRRIRKRNGGLCIASQRVDDFNLTQQGQAVITNAYTTFLLNHQESEMPALRKAFNLDDGVIENIIQTERGRVLIKQGNRLYVVQTQMFENEKRVVVTSPQNLT